MAQEPVAELVSFLKAEWERLLLVNNTNDEDNFFVLGGDSMLGTILMFSLMEATGVELSLYDLYENATLDKLTELIISRMT